MRRRGPARVACRSTGIADGLAAISDNPKREKPHVHTHRNVPGFLEIVRVEITGVFNSPAEFFSRRIE
jgi:hypothetical protein